MKHRDLLLFPFFPRILHESAVAAMTSSGTPKPNSQMEMPRVGKRLWLRFLRARWVSNFFLADDHDLFRRSMRLDLEVNR